MRNVMLFALGALALFVGFAKAASAEEAPAAPAAAAPAPVDSNTVKLKLAYGDVYIRLLPEKAPKHVERIKKLVNEKFYDGIVFHRVIEGFMAQTGDPTGTGSGGSKYEDLPAEFNDTPHKRGTVSMARASDPNSANSQFFICFADTPYLDGQYTAFGQVLKGMEFVDMIKKGASGSGSVQDPDKIISMTLVPDAEVK